MELSKGMVGRYEKNDPVPKGDYIVTVCRLTGANPYWILTGEGPESWRIARREGGAADAHYLAREVQNTLDRVMGELDDSGGGPGDGREDGPGQGGE